MAIHLSGLPGEPSLSGGGRAAHFPRLALLRVGFTEPPRSPSMLVRSYRTLSPLPVRARRPAIGGFLSVALSCGSPRLAVSQHPALRSPDLPRHDPAERPVPRPPGRLTVSTHSAITRHVTVTRQRIGRVSSMSGGPRQLFDPEAPPEAAASDLRTASGGDEADGPTRGPLHRRRLRAGRRCAQRGLSPEPAPLGPRGDPAGVGSSLGPSLSEPGRSRGREPAPGPVPGRRAHAQREVLAQLVGTSPARTGQAGH